ncbi:MAG: ATP-dependent 6-phosphofructokinase [Deltaproteobacteria bacterium]|nr:ATP-dependent 6-phosphofructokinase [Deltaproteobacteria bacterium]MBW1948085.1 ATP-dependent 6-phosphofructokinase [Deltaproteobacteria bacterium]MBW2006510.1 ATP-dependent 6-phosphofructokinase [Deltaproteobacteria bacterium]MBW2101242.1 ATP-dependent 6-phosphofructokinase [Deltaproteobacteria bacterium]MBW2346442.1 ATP-dependent 6-phosphofructokinase [Deltaproteobacteria bacterium]
MKVKVGVLSAGGDCPGINSTVHWLVYSALDKDLAPERGMMFEVLGIVDGWKGLMEVKPDNKESLKHWTLPLDKEMVRTWDRYGGTRLGTSRVNPFDPKKDRSAVVVENVEKLGLDALVVIGGFDNLGVAYKLYREGVRVVGIPKTIDRDIAGTDYTLGFDSAVNIITEDIDRLRITAGSHSRVFVVESMGRQAGWLALEAGEAAGVSIILIPEHDFLTERVIDLLQARKKSFERYSIVLVSEGAKPRGMDHVYEKRGRDGFGHHFMGGIGGFLAEEIQKHTDLEVRYVALRHLQRGGSPTAYDRRMGRKFGVAAIDMIVNEDFGRMASLRHGEMTSVPLKKALERLNLVDVERFYNTKYYRSLDRIL